MKYVLKMLAVGLGGAALIAASDGFPKHSADWWYLQMMGGVSSGIALGSLTVMLAGRVALRKMVR